MTWDTKKTKRLLLNAARVEFSEYGIDGARVDRIAERAGVNKERIYGHFGNKEQLFRHVLVEAMRELGEIVRPGEGPVGDFAKRIYEFHRNDSSLLRLLMFEALHYGSSLADQDATRIGHYRRAAAELRKTHGYSEQESYQVLLTIIGACAWPFVMPQLTSMCLGDTEPDKDAFDRLGEFIQDFAERGGKLATPT